ncbi:type I-E CRISPR-associated protein Cas5/CasD [Citreicella sp. C3M06]|uniref:type I-E CRISPR-associated protein Cas5/CasD n=1 Tax=Citreicella sp. C3M06 TaxID=2841564 RepID=UPI002091AAB6|nr:type I-E CRISPR-associated protein Cas5/CasD [Citreicella sp. C3M06]
MRDWLHLTLRAPLMAFGGVAIDHMGPTRDFPSLSAMTGLLANALGYERYQGTELQALQDRLIIGALTSRQGRRLTDNQNARVYDKEPGWTTYGQPESRNSGPSYGNPARHDQLGNQAGRKWLTHRRSREYLADHETRVVLRLEGVGAVDLDDLRQALMHPARPLFIGRKTCLPTAPIFTGTLRAETVLDALRAIGLPGHALWPADAGDGAGTASPQDLPPGAMSHDLPDLRNWLSGLHTGRRGVIEGFLT